MPPRPLGGAFRGPGGNAEQMGLDWALPEPLQPLPGGLSVPTPHHPGRGCSAHDWGQGGRKGLTEADRGQGWLAQDQGQGSPEPPGTAERWREAGGQNCPFRAEDRALGGPGTAEGWQGAGSPSHKARHLSECSSSRSTASARLSTYPSAFTSGWCSSLGLEGRATGQLVD